MHCLVETFRVILDSRYMYVNFINLFSLFPYLLLEKGGAFHLNKLQSPSPKDALFQGGVKLAYRFWRGRLFNFVNIFSVFCY